jgi:hypothetical protein
MKRSTRVLKAGERGNCLIAFLILMGIIFIVILVFSGGACCAGASKAEAIAPSDKALAIVPA